MMKKGQIPTALLCLSAATMASAQDAVPLVRLVRVGEVATYALKTEVDLAGRKSIVTGKVAEKTTKVDANGNYTVESTYSDTKVKAVGGTEIEQTQAPDTVVFKANGELSKLVGDKIDPTMVRLANLMVVKMPAKPVKAGDSWSHEIAADAKTGAVASKADYKVTVREKVGLYDCVAVLVKYRELAGDRPATCDETIWLDVATGTLVKREAVLKNVPMPSGGIRQAVNATVSVLRDQPTAAPLPPIKSGG